MSKFKKGLESKSVVLGSVVFYLLVISFFNVRLLFSEYLAFTLKFYSFLQIIFAIGLLLIFILDTKSKATKFTAIITLILFFAFLDTLDFFFNLQMLLDGIPLINIIGAMGITFEISLEGGYLLKTYIIPIVIIITTLINYSLTISRKITINNAIFIPILIIMYHLFVILTSLSVDNLFYILRLVGEISFQVVLIVVPGYLMNRRDDLIIFNKDELNLENSNIKTDNINKDKITDSSISILKEEKNIGFCIIMSILTFGIYHIIWLNSMVKKIRVLNNESTDTIGELLALIFIPFYSIYWVYTRSQKLFFSSKKINIQLTDNSVINLILSLFGLSIVSYAIIQNDLNTIGRSITSLTNNNNPEDSKPNEVSSDVESLKTSNLTNLDLISKLSDLKDKGVITEDEFINKKKELLDKI